MQRVIWLLLLLTCCQKEQPKELFRFESHQMGMHLIVQTESECGVAQIIERTFDEVNRIYNNWNPDSEISFVNHLPAHQPVLISPDLARFLQSVGRIVKMTEGRFDPTVEPLQKVWKEELKQGRCPDQERLTALQESVGWSKIHLTGQLIYKDHPDTAIDLSGVAKGYAVDLLAMRLEEAGCANFLIDWAGELKAVGQHPSGRCWKVAIVGSETIDLDDTAIATSGSYLQHWEVEGKDYTHVIDPFKKAPLHNQTIVSASVVLDECATADAIATALMLFPSSAEAEAWFYHHFPQGQLWLVVDP